MKSRIIVGLFFAIFLWTFPGTVLPALSLTELVGSEQAAVLEAGDKPVVTQFKDPRPQLVPQHMVLRGIVDAVQQELNPSVMVETLHIYKKPPEAQKVVWSAEEEARLYNEVLALSTLAGLQYYSATRGTMRTFYETSRVIDGPSTKKPLPDPVYSRPPSELTVYARQKDLTFGDNIYQYSFYTVPGALIFIQQNLTTLTVGPIPAVGRNNLRSTVAILDAGEYLLVYASSMAKVISLLGMNERVGNSFANRVDAVLNWFSSQADKAFEKVNP